MSQENGGLSGTDRIASFPITRVIGRGISERCTVFIKNRDDLWINGLTPFILPNCPVFALFNTGKV